MNAAATATWVLFWLAALMTAAPVAAAQPAFPSKPLRLIVPFPPGGGGDFTARLISQKLDKVFGQRILVDNRPGGDQIIGSELLARSPPDGHTFMLATAAHALNPSLGKKLPYNAVSDFMAVTRATEFPYLIVVHPSVQARSVKELISFARTNPNALALGTSAILPQLASDWMFELAKVKVTHVPYKGAGPVLSDLIGGHIDVAMAAPAGPMPLLRSGRLRAVAVTSSVRSPFFPDVPTVIEGGVPDYEIIGWHGFLAPAGTAAENITRLSTALISVLKMPDVAEQFAKSSTQIVGSTPDVFSRFIKAEMVKWRKAVVAIGFKPD